MPWNFMPVKANQAKNWLAHLLGRYLNISVGQYFGRSVISFSKKQLIDFFWNFTWSVRELRLNDWRSQIFQENFHFGEKAEEFL